jgi:hypothetical protein
VVAADVKEKARSLAVGIGFGAAGGQQSDFHFAFFPTLTIGAKGKITLSPPNVASKA